MSHWSSLRVALYGLVAACATALAIQVTSSPAFAASTDVGGNWNYNMSVSGLGSFSCYSQNQLVGSDLTMDINCNLVGSGVLVGTFDKPTGSFDAFGSVGGQQMQLFGSAPDDFNMSGSVSLSQSGSGTFSGFRDTPFVGGVAQLARGTAPEAQSSASNATDAWFIAGMAAAIGIATFGGATLVVARRR